jgi:hypothetical protein
MKTKPRLVSVTDQYGDELWIAPASTVRKELEENRARPMGDPMATRSPTFADAPLLTRLDVLAAAALVGFGAGLIVGFAL